MNSWHSGHQLGPVLKMEYTESPSSDEIPPLTHLEIGGFAKVLMSRTPRTSGVEKDAEAAIANFQAQESAATQRDKAASGNINFGGECADMDVIVVARRERSIAEAAVLVRIIVIFLLCKIIKAK